jgi:hypothetical protein
LHSTQLRIGIGRYKDDGELDDDAEYFDGAPTEDYEDPAYARPSDVGGIHVTDEVIARLIDLAIVHLRSRNISYRAIGRFLNRSEFFVRKRYREIPEEVRRYYGNRKAHDSFFGPIAELKEA